MNDLNEDITAWKIRVTGRVQGVGFRYSTLQKASRLRLTGWVRNEWDGSVGIYCEGLKSRTDALLDWLDKGGPSYSRIDRVEKTPARPQGTYSRFSVEY